MLSSFFGKSKPINFLLIAIYVSTLYSINLYQNGFSFEQHTIIWSILGLVSYILGIILLNAIAQENEITQNNSYTILLFAIFTTLLFKAFLNPKILIANTFVIWSLRSILKLQNQKSIHKKVLNASLCIEVASLCYFWSILFLVVVYFGVLYYASQNYRNWMIPVIGLLIVFVFATCFELIAYNHFFSFQEYWDSISIVFYEYNTAKIWVVVGVISLAILFFFTNFMMKYKRRFNPIKPMLKLIIVGLFVGLTIWIIAPNKNSAELFFLMSPLAIMGSNFLESNQKSVITEIGIWIFLLIPFVLLF